MESELIFDPRFKNAAKKQRESVERLSRPTFRRKTVYVHPYASQDDRDYITISIPQDMTHLHQLLDKIQAEVNYKLITPVVGLYRYGDRSRIHSVRDIQNNEHLIYVCEGEIKGNSYASSQSSEGSFQQQRNAMVSRQNSGRSSPGFVRQHRRYDNMGWPRSSSMELDHNGLVVMPSVNRQYQQHQQSLRYNLPQRSQSQRSDRLSPLAREDSKRRTTQQQQQQQQQQLQQEQLSRQLPYYEGGRKPLRNSYNSRNLKVFQTMPRHQEQDEFQESDNSYASQRDSEESKSQALLPRRAVSFLEGRSRFNHSRSANNDDVVVTDPKSPAQQRGNSQADLQLNTDNFSFDVRINEEEELSTTPTYGRNSKSFPQRSSEEWSGRQVEATRSRSFQESSFGSEEIALVLENTKSYSLKDNLLGEKGVLSTTIEQERNKQEGMDKYDYGSNRVVGMELNQDGALNRLSRVQDAANLMPIIPETDYILSNKNESGKDEALQNQQDEITLSMNLKDIQEAAAKEWNRQREKDNNVQRTTNQIQIPRLQLDNARENLRMLDSDNVQDSDLNTSQLSSNRQLVIEEDDFDRQQARIIHQNNNSYQSRSSFINDNEEYDIMTREMSTGSFYGRSQTPSYERSQTPSYGNRLSYEDYQDYPHNHNRPDDPLERGMLEIDYGSDLQGMSSYTPIDDYVEDRYERPKTPFYGEDFDKDQSQFYADEDVQRAIEAVEQLGNGYRSQGREGGGGNSNPLQAEYSGDQSQTSVNSNRDVQISRGSESTSRRKVRKQSSSRSRKLSASFWKCMYLPNVNEE